MQVHERENKAPERRDVNLGGEGGLKWYRALKGTDETPFEFVGHSLRKNDQIHSSLPMCGKGVDLTKPHKVKNAAGKITKIHPPAFEEVVGMIPANTVTTVSDGDPRTKKEIAEDIFLAVGEKISPAQLGAIGRPDLLATETRLLFERDKDAQTAVIDPKVM